MDLKVGYLRIPVLPMPADMKDEDTYGEFSDDTIFIDGDLRPEEQARILIHELMHAIYRVYSIPDELCDEERVCGTLDRPLAALFMDNPGLPSILDDAQHNGKPIVVEKVKRRSGKVK